MQKLLFCLVYPLLIPTLGRSQTTPDQHLMALVRLYEQAQDSVFNSATRSPERRHFLDKTANKAQLNWQYLQTTTDSNNLIVAEYLFLALRIYRHTEAYAQVADSATKYQMKQLRASADSILPTGFPLRFEVMGYPVIMQYSDVLPDLQLYYQELAPLCSCAELKTLMRHLKTIHADQAAKVAQINHRIKCRKRF
jgi:hypothetical protein